jgi:hypothetical protein
MDGSSETRLRHPRYFYPSIMVLWDRCEGYQDKTSITLPQLCQNYMTLYVRIGKIDRLRPSLGILTLTKVVRVAGKSLA